MVRDARRGPRSLRGSITLLALCISAAIGIALGSYISLCIQSAKLGARLAQQEKANELAQAGLEEALWALNQNNWTSSGPDGATAWTTSGTSRTATITYSMAGQGVTGQVTLAIANYASTGPTWPTISVNAVITSGDGVTSTNALQASTQPTPLFGNAIASSESYVSFVGGGTVDSWNSDPDNDSSTPLVPYSFTAGNAANYNAVVAGRTDGTYGVRLTQAKVLGYVATSGMPVSYSTSGSPSGKVVGPSTDSGTDVDTARLGKSAFVPLSSVFSTTLPTPTVGGGGLLNTVFGLVTQLGLLPLSGGTIKYTGDLTLDGGLLGVGLGNSVLTIDKPTKIIVDGDLNITTNILGGSGKITINAPGSLELYVTGDINIGALGIINNTSDPRKLGIFSTSSSTTSAITYNVTPPSSFYGTVFSENKPIDIKQNATFYGALLSRQYVRFSGSATAPTFHYDVALRQARYSAISTPYVISQVTKL